MAAFVGGLGVGCGGSVSRRQRRRQCVVSVATEPKKVGSVAFDPNVPSESGRFGKFGGQYVPDTLMPALEELVETYERVSKDPEFQAELDGLLKDYVGRATPLYFAERLTERYRRPDGSGPQIYLKREDLNHTGAHKINNSLGQALLARKLGRKRIIAETGAGQHGVATATVCARFGLECIVYMGARDIERQSLNVFRMKLLGAEVKPVTAGTATLTNALSEAIRDWVTRPKDTHYIVGSVAGPHPYPMIVRDFQAVIGREVREQCLEKFNGKPDIVIACVGGGSNAMGIFHEFVRDSDVRLIGVEAAGEGVDSQKHAATMTKGRVRSKVFLFFPRNTKYTNRLYFFPFPPLSHSTSSLRFACNVCMAILCCALRARKKKTPPKNPQGHFYFFTSGDASVSCQAHFAPFFPVFGSWFVHSLPLFRMLGRCPPRIDVIFAAEQRRTD